MFFEAEDYMVFGYEKQTEAIKKFVEKNPSLKVIVIPDYNNNSKQIDSSNITLCGRANAIVINEAQEKKCLLKVTASPTERCLSLRPYVNSSDGEGLKLKKPCRYHDLAQLWLWVYDKDEAHYAAHACKTGQYFDDIIYKNSERLGVLLEFVRSRYNDLDVLEEEAKTISVSTVLDDFASANGLPGFY